MITLDGVTKTYDGRRVVGPLSLAIPEGQFVALIGGSGCGKTTTLKMINALTPPESGTIGIDGAPIGAEPLAAVRRRIGYVFQEVGLFPHMTVAENIAVGPRLAKWPKARVTARISELLTLINLPQNVAGRLPAALSGGQRQRVGLARALAAGPRVMLMDEPFGALDPVTRDALGQDYRALHDQLGLTTVMVTHDVMEALLLADRIVALDAGAIRADATPAELMSPGGAERTDPSVRALLETPRRQMRRLEALAESNIHG